MQKTTSLSAPKADTISTVKYWLNSESRLFSALLETKTTHRQVLLITHCMTAFFAFILTCSTLIGAAISIIWFAFSLLLARKGGLK